MYRTIADAQLDERIRKLELAISRCSDETVSKASQGRLNKLYRERAEKQK